PITARAIWSRRARRWMQSRRRTAAANWRRCRMSWRTACCGWHRTRFPMTRWPSASWRTSSRAPPNCSTPSPMANPITHTPPTPVQLATLLRGQNRINEAIDVLAKARQQFEPELTKDAQRNGWVAVLRYHHGVALREAKKYSEARAAFESVVKQFAGRPEAA